MTIKYIDVNNTISYYASASIEYTTTVPSSSVTQSITTQSVTQSVFNNYSWVEGTGSTYSEWTFISGTSEIATSNPNNDDDSMGFLQIGSRIAIRGNEIFTNVFLDSSTAENNGIAIYDSSSSGWYLKDYINIPTASYQPATIGVEFDVSGDYMIAPVDAGGSSTIDGKLLIYKSSSAGWAVEQTLTTSSYNSGSAVNDSDGRYAFMSSKISGDTIFANGFYSGYYDRFVAFFKSSSAGWAFEDEVQVGDSNDTGFNSTNGSLGITGVATSFDGTTAVMGSRQGEGSQYYHNASGKVHIFESGSTGWVENKIGLFDLGLTASVTGTFGNNDTGAQEYRTWELFGHKACAVSGNYIVAAAQGKNIYNSSTGQYRRQRHSVFVLKSGSAGWAIDARIDDPATNLIATGTQGATSDTEFGAGVAINQNSIVINSPEWQDDWSSGKTQGRSYVYVSKSATGWELDQIIDNPYSGSVFEDQGSSGTNMQMGYNNQGGYANAGGVGYNSLPAISSNWLALNAPKFSRFQDPSGSFEMAYPSGVYADQIWGDVILLSGSANYEQQVTQQTITESVTTTVYITQSGGPVPFRFAGGRSITNIRNQDASSSYTTYKP